MTLKGAYFPPYRVPRGSSPSASPTSGPPRRPGLGLGVAWPGHPGRYNYHDIEAWALLLASARASRPGQSYADPMFGGRVVDESRHLKRVWSEMLRYHKNVAYDFELRRARDAASWLLAHSSDL